MKSTKDILDALSALFAGLSVLFTVLGLRYMGKTPPMISHFRKLLNILKDESLHTSTHFEVELKAGPTLHMAQIRADNAKKTFVRLDELTNLWEEEKSALYLAETVLAGAMLALLSSGLSLVKYGLIHFHLLPG